MPRKHIALSGKKFGRLTVQSEISKGRYYFANCLCECGNEKIIPSTNITSGHSKSCGCLAVHNSKKHGLAGSKEYDTWSRIKQRCYNNNFIGYDKYGGRGIVVCDRWMKSFENFLLDMGVCPSPNHSIDRENNNGNYEPENCRWATNKEQAGNKRNNRWIEYDGAKTIASDLAVKLNVPLTTLRRWDDNNSIHKMILNRKDRVKTA